MGSCRQPMRPGDQDRGLLVTLPFSLLCPDHSKSLRSPARLSHLPLGSARATPTRRTRPPTAPSPAQLPPRPAGTPTPVSPTGRQGSVGGEPGQDSAGELAEALSQRPEFGGLSPELPEPGDQAWGFAGAVVFLGRWGLGSRLSEATLSCSRLWDRGPVCRSAVLPLMALARTFACPCPERPCLASDTRVANSVGPSCT